MKIFKTSILLIVLFTACNQSSKNDNVFQSDKLKGKYKVDLTPVIAKAVKKEEGDDEWDKMGKGLAGLALSSVDIEMSFYENNKGVMHFSGGLVDFANAFSDQPSDNIKEFVYKVEKDSILYMKDKKSDEFKKWAIVRKFSENYDYLKFLILNEDGKHVFFNLKKVNQ